MRNQSHRHLWRHSHLELHARKGHFRHFYPVLHNLLHFFVAVVASAKTDVPGSIRARDSRDTDRTRFLPVVIGEAAQPLNKLRVLLLDTGQTAQSAVELERIRLGLRVSYVAQVATAIRSVLATKSRH